MSPSGAVSGKFWWAINAAALLVFPFVLNSCISAAAALSPTATSISPTDNPIIKVNVFDQDGKAIKNAIVRVSQPPQVDDYDNDGYWVQTCVEGQSISVWAPGYVIWREPCQTGKTPYSVKLNPLSETDNMTYSWKSAAICGGCHTNSGELDEFTEWKKDGHSTVFSDYYFWTMYTGMDINRILEAQTQRKMNSTGQQLRVQGGGTGYRLDFPNERGNCAYCHAPTIVQGTTQLFDLSDLINSYMDQNRDVRTEGITCDVCHKVTGVVLGDNQLPYSDRPGVLSLSTAVPSFNPQIVLGPNSDVSPPRGTDMSCLSIYSESQFCAACHYGKFADTVIYNSYGEWLQSKYSSKKVNPDGSGKVENTAYRSCQDCHMLSDERVKDTHIANRAACSAESSVFKNFDHNMMKYANGGKHNSFPNVPQLIEDAATLTVKNEYDANTNSLLIHTTVENVKAGHKFPTDSPLRHLILVVEATDEFGNLLPQIGGDVIPLWGGVGNTQDDYAGKPGKIYANLLADRDTNIFPTAAYWNPTKQVFANIANGNSSDTRLAPNVPDNDVFAVAVPSSGMVSITVKLVYRYAFIELARQKGWTRLDSSTDQNIWMRPDVIVTRADCVVNANELETADCK